MAKKRKKIPPAIKSHLFKEAGEKCANPGCSAWRVHYHHIKQWAIYATNDQKHMIAICPNCHDAVHHGRLEITDETLYRWKGIARPEAPDTAHIYVEPGKELKVILGAFATMTVWDRMIIFQRSDAYELGFSILDGDLLQLNASLRDLRGEQFLRVVSNHVRVKRDDSVVFDTGPGRAVITVPATGRYIPEWLADQMRLEIPTYAQDGRVTVLDIEVMEPGVVRAQGVWCSASAAAVVTADSLYTCREGAPRPFRMTGLGGHGILRWQGPPGQPLLQIAVDGRPLQLAPQAAPAAGPAA